MPLRPVSARRTPWIRRSDNDVHTPARAGGDDVRRTAVIDLGSNSFRLVVFSSGDGWWKRTDEIYEAVRIGAGLNATGRLSAERVARALAVVDVFEHFCDASAIAREDVVAVATSAVRDASNRDDFLGRASLPVRVLPVEEEARYGYLAAVNSTTLSDGAVLDLGGGSVQLVSVAERLATEIGSWPLGAVRVTERFLADGAPASRKQLKAVRTHVAAELESAPWIRGAGGRLVGIGGTVRNLAAAAGALAGLPSVGVQGAIVTRAALDDLVDRLAGVPADERGKLAGIKPARAELILAGAVVIQAIAELGDFDAVEATEAGLREGIFFERHLSGREPPLFDDVRRATVRNLADQYTPDRRHSDHVAHLALEMFDGLAATGVHAGDRAERDLLWAAAELHDIGMAVDYDDHHKHSRYLVLSSGLPGFSPREEAIVAEMVRYHRKGTPTFSDELAPLITDGDREILARGATLLRLAEGLERSRDQAVRSVAISVEDSGSVRLAVDAGGPLPVAQWAAEREVGLFRRAYARPLEITQR